MTTFHLYRSGIHDAIFEFQPEKPTCQKRDVIRNQWQSSSQLTEKEAETLEGYYHINPLDVYNRFNEYRHLFQTDQTEIETSWGATYYKDETTDHLWVERFRKFPLDIVVEDGAPVAFISPSRENVCVLVKEGYEAYTPVHLWQDESISPAVYGIQHIGNHMVKTRDGIKLATDVWLPKDKEGPHAVIFVRTPYGRMMFENAYTHFIQRGYAVVIQDTRGRQDSEGEWVPMYHEVEDGDDSLDWIAEQSWCDGNIGMIGASYGGYVQWAAAASGNPHLKALLSIVTAGSPFVDIPRKGGAFVSGMLAWAFAMVEKTFKPENMIRDDWDDVLSIRPIKDIPEKALGMNVPFWNQWMSHSTNDAFWKASSWIRGRDNIKTPAMIVSGWFDDNGMGTTEALEVTQPYAPEDRKVILGPWLHNGNTTRDIQGVQLGNNALRHDIDYQYQKWFDHKLKGITNDITQSATVEYYDTGINTWQQAENWPPQDVTWTKVYLSSTEQTQENVKNTSDHDNGILQYSPEDTKGKTSYVYNPDNPADQLIDMSENEVGVPADYQQVERRDDVLVYNMAPLDEPITVVGDIYMTLYASSTAKDTDWVIRVTDVEPGGTSTKLVDGVLRARYRYGYEKEVLLEPGKVEKYTIRTSKLAHTFKKGHQIRVTVTSSANHFIFPNSNTGNDPAADTDTVEATQTIFHNADYPTHVNMPILANKE